MSSLKITLINERCWSFYCSKIVGIGRISSHYWLWWFLRLSLWLLNITLEVDRSKFFLCHAKSTNHAQMSGSLLFYWTFSFTFLFRLWRFRPYWRPVSWNSDNLSSFGRFCCSSLSLHHLIVSYHLYLHTAFLIYSIFDKGLNLKVFRFLTKQIHKQGPFWSMQVHASLCIVKQLFKLDAICICDTLRTRCWE